MPPAADKQREIIPYMDGEPWHYGNDFLLSELPNEIFVEGIDRATGHLSLYVAAPQTTLFSNTESTAPGSGSAEFTDRDTIKVTTGLGLTAYRPMHGPGTYDPFRKTAVKEADEGSSTLGPGIRINGDYDNGDEEVRDLHLTDVVIPTENDLIEVRIDRLPGMGDLVLDVGGSLSLYTTPTKGTQIYIDSGTGRTDPLNFTGETLFVYAEWHQLSHGTDELKLIESATNAEIDKLVFHSFQSVVIGLSGETFGPIGGWLGLMTALQNPAYDIAVDFYERGYDIHYYDVWDHTAGSAQNDFLDGPAVDEAVNAINNREVDNVAIFGHSHGGGATWSLAAELERLLSNETITRPFLIRVTGYIDAVQYNQGLATFNPVPESLLPPMTLAHGNWYQTNMDPFAGTSVPGSVVDDDMTSSLTNPNVQDHVEVAFEVWRLKLLLDFFQFWLPVR